MMSAPLLLAIDHNGDVPILTGSVKKHRQYIDARSENNIYRINFYCLYHKYRSYCLLAIGDLSITDCYLLGVGTAKVAAFHIFNVIHWYAP